MSAYDSALEAPPQPLEQFVHEPGCSDGIDFQSLEAGTTVHVHTRYSSYRLVVTDPENGAALVTGGRLFPNPRRFASKAQRPEARRSRPGGSVSACDLEMLKSHEPSHDVGRAVDRGSTAPVATVC